MRVLLVEDEIRLADTIKRGLNDHGFVVDVAHDGDEGSGSRPTASTT